MRLPHSFVAFLFPVLASGAITNTTFDDFDSTFNFNGGNWAALTPSSPCKTNCTVQPDPSQIHEGTWHAGTIQNGQSILTTVGSFTFTGSAVYIFGIDQAGSPNIWFALDGNKDPATAKEHHYTGTQFVYNSLFFSATGLPTDKTHTVGWGLQASGNSVPPAGQVALFDYAIVTTGEEEDGLTVTPTHTGSTTMTSALGTDQASAGTGDTTQSKNGGSQLTPTTPTPSSLGDKSSTVTSSLPGSRHLTSSGTDTGADGNPTAAPQSASSRPKSKSNLGAIIGAVIGALFAALVAIFVWLRNRRVRRQRAADDSVDDSTTRSQFLPIEPYPLHTTQNTLPLPDPAEVGDAVPVSLDKSMFKRQRVKTNSISIPTHLNTLPQIEPSVSVSPRPTISSTSRNFRLIEERLAMLEAQAAINQQPPPYVPEDDD
ncbi:hypothetical protein B0H19DRAFT_1273521 [Mycena capillaripes]|nr:hypothetical protein B0H19DRAFT_1273521 [Mycena capillaripes]